ncbi:MAG: hypothetical protein COU08_02655 [Candidatus Harrisonbacteria bacterium CG10_big_fil_rev_8_21_14_0_10_42_17]|uniref:DNA polymerase III subunit delta n=1 Tax=Candidatus Harrisonbacteria bacterium CG10_big_fil_rev_8_21_14_0_10_42_17 TaxID=1974584 RepID=A0A2M6WHW7_9BACT|nr:MAG: hypothetical protein COU08_02655 [Candidatus Harrisonbacteria bacterium CG10_big_fil_rev_8_21_14_0_10_42_17]
MAFTEKLTEDLKKLIDENRLSHGYIFFGENNNAKQTFAEKVSRYIETRKWEGSETLVDQWIAETEGSVGIETSKKLSQFLWQKPIVSSRRTAIIPRADRFTLHAQNAILKIAEEPPEHGLIILLVNHIEQLLPALGSRFFKIHISEPFAVEDISPSAKTAVKQFLKNTTKERSEFLKEVIESMDETEQFVYAMMEYLQKDKLKNWIFLKKLYASWQTINQLNVNKRLHLEAALLRLPQP